MSFVEDAAISLRFHARRLFAIQAATFPSHLHNVEVKRSSGAAVSSGPTRRVEHLPTSSRKLNDTAHLCARCPEERCAAWQTR